MLYLKTCNNLVYVDFTKKDFSDFIYKHGKDNVNKITLIVNEIEPTCLYWISRIASIEKYNKIKFIINTVSYRKLYLDFIRRILKEFPLLRKRSKINGGVFSISCNNLYYSFYKDGYYLGIRKHGDGFGAYSERAADEDIYCDMFGSHGACIYGPPSIYNNGREYKWKYMLQLAIAMTGSQYYTVDKEQSMDIYHKYLTHQFYQFKDLKGKKGKLPDGTIVDMSKLYVSPPMSDTIGDFNTVTICEESSSSCESYCTDD